MRNKIKSSMYQVIDHCKETKIGLIEFASNSNNYFKFYDLTNNSDLFEFIVLNGNYKEKLVEYVKGVDLQIIVDHTDTLVGIVPPTLTRG